MAIGRASYLLLDDGQASIRRVEYDVDIELSAAKLPGVRMLSGSRAFWRPRAHRCREDAAMWVVNLLRAGTRLLGASEGPSATRHGMQLYLALR